jgi:hypothetical protein
VGVFVLVTLGVLVCDLVGVGVLEVGVMVGVDVGDVGGFPGPGLVFIRTQLTISQKLYIKKELDFFNYYQILLKEYM